MKCEKCGEEMVCVCEDEGGMMALWCYKCGSIAHAIIGEDEFEDFYEVGTKPDFEDFM